MLRVVSQKGYPCDGVMHPCPLNILKDTKAPTMVEHIHFNEQGEEINVEVRCLPIYDEEGNLAKFIEYAMDITDRKRAESELKDAKERAERATIAKTNFLSNMSHEIRTPMNVIIGMTQLLLDSDLAPHQRKHVEMIREASQGLLQLLNDILDISKNEAGKFTFEVIAFDLHKLLKGVIGLFEQQAAKKDLSLELDIKDTVPRYIKSDPLRLKQVLINLISNAIKFTNQGGVFVRVENKKLQQNQVTLLFSVKDTGIGIDKDKQSMIFENFSQADPSIFRRFGGTGLGLSISSMIIGMMGGVICLESELNKGSEFSFILTFDRTDESEVKKDDETTVGQSRHANILVVEDNEMNQVLIKSLLEKYGHSVAIAKTAKEALSLVDERAFDLILMDIILPEIDGYEATKIIRSRDSSALNSGVPIIALTANVSVEQRQRCLEAGMDDYLTKLINKSQLLRMIQKYVSSTDIQPRSKTNGETHRTTT